MLPSWRRLDPKPATKAAKERLSFSSLGPSLTLTTIVFALDIGAIDGNLNLLGQPARPVDHPIAHLHLLKGRDYSSSLQGLLDEPLPITPGWNANVRTTCGIKPVTEVSERIILNKELASRLKYQWHFFV
jgi:hypothetical protein